MSDVIPAEKQLAFQDWELGVFLHFGIRTFYEGHHDWDGKPMPAEGFRPSALDCDQWVQTAEAAGFRYMVLTAKHHDGFANWPSRVSDYSVARTLWKGGKGDVIREFTDACRRHGVKAGLYYSPAEVHNRNFRDDPNAYDEHFLTQITELLAGYGEISVLWFDGCGSDGHQYDWPRITAEIRRLQPGILIFNMGDPDYRWVGNEAGVAPLGVSNVVHGRWLPAECDCRMRLRNWFHSDRDEDTVKSLDQLMGLYYYSVGRGCNLLINIGPDRRGLLPDRDARALLAFGAEIRRRFGSPVATLKDCRRAADRWECEWKQPVLIDHAVIQEEISRGEHVRRFAVAVSAAPHGTDPIPVYEGHTIGHKAVCPFPPVEAVKAWVEIRQADGPVDLRALEFHNAAGRR